jgi:NADH dehydrogenase
MSESPQESPQNQQQPKSGQQTSPTKVLVTGASGFVGHYLVRELLKGWYVPVCLVRNPHKLSEQLTDEEFEKITVSQGNVLDPRSLDKAAVDCEAAVHLVGILEEKPSRGQTFSRIHVEATRNVIQACQRAGIRRYLHMSALGARPDATSKYHQTKWFAEQQVRESGLDWTIFRPSLIHGPDSEFIRMMKFFSTHKLRQPVLPYFGRGNNRIQPVSVHDVVTCFAKALNMPQTIHQLYELGGPERFTWKEFYDICSTVFTGHKRFKVPVPTELAKLAAQTVVPLMPSAAMPFKFNVDQVQMTQEDNICTTEAVESTFNIQMRDFREELAEYADQVE